MPGTWLLLRMAPYNGSAHHARQLIYCVHIAVREVVPSTCPGASWGPAMALGLSPAVFTPPTKAVEGSWHPHAHVAAQSRGPKPPSRGPPASCSSKPSARQSRHFLCLTTLAQVDFPYHYSSILYACYGNQYKVGPRACAGRAASCIMPMCAINQRKLELHPEELAWGPKAVC